MKFMKCTGWKFAIAMAAIAGWAQVLQSASCPYCGQVYGEGQASGADAAYISNIRAQHEATCWARNQGGGSSGGSSGSGGGARSLIGGFMRALLTPAAPSQPGVDPIAAFLKEHPPRNGGPQQLNLGFGRKSEPVGASTTSEARAKGSGFTDGRGGEVERGHLPIQPMPKGAQPRQVPARGATRYSGGYTNTLGAAFSALWHGRRAKGSDDEEAAEELRNVFDRPGKKTKVGGIGVPEVKGAAVPRAQLSGAGSAVRGERSARTVPDSLWSNPKFVRLEKRRADLDLKIAQAKAEQRKIEAAHAAAKGRERNDLAGNVVAARDAVDKLNQQSATVKVQQDEMIRMELEIIESGPGDAREKTAGAARANKAASGKD